MDNGGHQIDKAIPQSFLRLGAREVDKGTHAQGKGKRCRMKLWRPKRMPLCDGKRFKGHGGIQREKRVWASTYSPEPLGFSLSV